MTQPSVAIIVINYNGAAVLDDLAASLAALTYTNYRLYLIDNASTDGSAAQLHTLFPCAEVILNEVNTGFAAAVNQALGVALTRSTDYVLLLNPDTTFGAGFLEPLVASADARTLVAPKIIRPSTMTLANHAGSFRWLGNRQRGNTDGQADGPAHSSPRIVEIASFACLLMPAAVFASVGMLDGRTGMYYEDADFCLRAGQAGFQVKIEPGAVLYHSHGASSGRNSPFTLYYTTRNRPYTVRKNGGMLRYLLFSPYFLYTHARQIGGEVRTRRWHHLRAHLRGLRDFYAGRMGMTYQPSDLNPPDQRY